MGWPVAVRSQGQISGSLRCCSLTDTPVPSYGGGAPDREESLASAAPRSCPPLGDTPRAVRNEFRIWEGVNRWGWHVSTRKVRPGGGEGPRQASTSTPTFPMQAEDKLMS